jgi:LmbE family N-acetylglucosaminyl deacetylase
MILREIEMNKKVLFIAPHPDDETLGAGGTILKHKAQGDKIFWLILTNIDTAFGWDLSCDGC